MMIVLLIAGIGSVLALELKVLADGVVVGHIFKANAAPVGEPWMWPLDAAPLIRIHGQHPAGGVAPRFGGCGHFESLRLFACPRFL